MTLEQTEVLENHQSSFDPIARLYHRLWNDWYLPAARPALGRLLFDKVVPPARILDVCCGSGHVTRELVAHGYQVTGVDRSANLLALARDEMPDQDWLLQDVRHLSVAERYDGALSTFDSLNHILELDELALVFQAVHRALHPGARFVFDMNLTEAFRADLRSWAVDASDSDVSLIRGSFEEGRQIARTQLIWFEQVPGENCWRRADTVIEERCYSVAEIQSLLVRAGFQRIEVVEAVEAGMQADLAFGRIFVSALA